MPFAKVGDILREAKKENRCVAAFNCFNYESIKTFINAGEKLESPVIVMLYPGMTSHIPISTFAAITKDLAAKSTQPVGLHLDHCDDFDFIMEAVKSGIQSVLIDGSRQDYQANAEMTRRVVSALRPLGADVEAELGHVGGGGNASDYTDSSKYTDPEEAKRFIEYTGADFLAVAAGNAHGHYAVPPKLDFERLKEINNAVDVPLVLHGGSGIPDDQIKEALKYGVAKTNFGTDYLKNFYNAKAGYINSDDPRKNIFGLLKAGEDGGMNFAENRILALKGEL
ncbi:MAG: class II fructose-bisphosphate aldolase [Oscillospiraceae bacterium]|nr:class II fructose-bisphosphate aldolase [Oscillospiraceae bacterium]